MRPDGSSGKVGRPDADRGTKKPAHPPTIIDPPKPEYIAPKRTGQNTSADDFGGFGSEAGYQAECDRRKEAWKAALPEWEAIMQANAQAREAS